MLQRALMSDVLTHVTFPPINQWTLSHAPVLDALTPTPVFPPMILPENVRRRSAALAVYSRWVPPKNMVGQCGTGFFLIVYTRSRDVPSNDCDRIYRLTKEVIESARNIDLLKRFCKEMNARQHARYVPGMSPFCILYQLIHVDIGAITQAVETQNDLIAPSHNAFTDNFVALLPREVITEKQCDIWSKFLACLVCKFSMVSLNRNPLEDISLAEITSFRCAHQPVKPVVPGILRKKREQEFVAAVQTVNERREEAVRSLESATASDHPLANRPAEETSRGVSALSLMTCNTTVDSTTNAPTSAAAAAAAFTVTPAVPAARICPSLRPPPPSSSYLSSPYAGSSGGGNPRSYPAITAQLLVGNPPSSISSVRFGAQETKFASGTSMISKSDC